MKSQSINLTRGVVRYFEAGAGRPLLLVHAFPLGAAQWQPQLASPPGGWRLIAPDLPGFGQSVPVVAGEPSMAAYASDLFELMSAIDVTTAAVAGLSMGGYVALAMMALAPERISGLVLADTRATADGAEARSARDRMVALVRRHGPAGVASEMIGKLLGDTSKRTRPDLEHTVRRLIEENRASGIEAAIIAMKERADHTSLLGRIACPTVVIAGAEDVITKPDECEAMSRHIPGARFVRIDGAGHLSNLECPDAFGNALASIASDV